ncbi:MAG: hypothetical protein Q7T83_00260 [Thermodesulfovibrionales bacterium]|nr:hypothetical protein [Thermodesulfovibrionales bacterium]
MKGNLISLIGVLFILIMSMAMTGCAVKSSGSQISSTYEEKRVGGTMSIEMEAAENGGLYPHHKLTRKDGDKIAGITSLNASNR